MTDILIQCYITYFQTHYQIQCFILFYFRCMKTNTLMSDTHYYHTVQVQKYTTHARYFYLLHFQ